MTRSLLEYKEYRYDKDELLVALYDKEHLEGALEDLRVPNTYKTELLFENDNTFLIAVYYYATESEEDNNRISKEA